MGIIYIMPDYTLSPVFNTRGVKILKDNNFKNIQVEDTIDISDDYLIINSNSNNPENSKGVFKIDYSNPIFNGVEQNFGQRGQPVAAIRAGGYIEIQNRRKHTFGKDDRRDPSSKFAAKHPASEVFG